MRIILNLLLLFTFSTFGAPILANGETMPDNPFGKPFKLQNQLSAARLEQIRESIEIKNLEQCGDIKIAEHQNPNFYEIYRNIAPQKDLLKLVDKNNNIGRDYKPADLVAVNEIYHLHSEAAQALIAMIAAAGEEDINIFPVSAYRSYNYQYNLFERRAKEAGLNHADKYIAKAGASQHQLGTAVDLNSTFISFEKTKEFDWLKQNAGRYGFSLSFPKNSQEITGYAFEPWHYRYLGKEAVKMQDMFFGGSQQKMLEFLNRCVFS